MLKISDLKEQRNKLKESIASTTAQINALDTLIGTMSSGANKIKPTRKYTKRQSTKQPSGPRGPKKGTLMWSILPVIKSVVLNKSHKPTCQEVTDALIARDPEFSSSYSSISSMLHQLTEAKFVTKEKVSGRTLRYGLSEKGAGLVDASN